MADGWQVCTLKIDNGIGSSITWVATAAAQDTAAGSGVSITITRTVTGSLIANEDTLDLDVFIDNGSTLVKNFSLTAQASSQSVTFYFTDTGNSGSSARCGSLRMRLHAVNTSAPLGTNRYNVDSDLTNNTPPSGSTVTISDSGWIRGTTTLVEDLSNTSLGGAPSSPAEYDESLFVRTTSGAISYTARALTVALSAGSVSGSTNSTTSTTRDVTFSNVCDERFPAASTSVGVTVTVPNATLTSSPDWTYTSTTDDTLNVDPRLTQALHFQVDDNVWGLTKHVAAKTMLSTESGFLWAKFTAARGTLKSGITANLTLDPTNPGTTVGPTSFVSDANGVAGPLEWTASKPGGAWAWTVDITAPSDIDADTHLITPTDTVTMIASNPNLRLVCGGGSATAAADTKHFVAGNAFLVGLVVFNVTTMQTVALDSGSAYVFIGRLNLSTGKAQYLASDNVTWTDATGGTVYGHALTVSPTDANVYTKTFSAAETANWGASDIFVVGKCAVLGVPVNDFAKEIVTNGLNNHDAYVFDGAGFVGFPVK